MNIRNLFNVENSIITGRGSTAIYLALINERITNSEIIVPGNICYAAVYPIVYSNNHPVFCDVSLRDGNIRLCDIKKVYTPKTKCIIAPHMYGNTIVELLKIREWCERRNVLLIEDCASALGSKSDIYGDVGNVGDYSIYSFGHSKNVDIGYGGMLISKSKLDKAKKELKKLPRLTRNIESKIAEYSSCYRKIRYDGGEYNNLIPLERKSMFLNMAEPVKIKNAVIKSYNNSIKKHNDNYNLYCSNINDKYIYKYHNGSVPWRFSLIVGKRKKKKIINNILEKGYPISDWYPNVTPIFNKKKLSNVDKMESKILNFPLDIDKKTIIKICKEINSVLEG